MGELRLVPEEPGRRDERQGGFPVTVTVCSGQLSCSESPGRRIVHDQCHQGDLTVEGVSGGESPFQFQDAVVNEGEDVEVGVVSLEVLDWP